jgi:hypothetical protein
VKLYWKVPFDVVVGEVEHNQVGLVLVRTSISEDGRMVQIDKPIRTVNLPTRSDSRLNLSQMDA